MGAKHFGARITRLEDPALLTEWQVYRMFDARRGAWSTFQYLVRERLREQGGRPGLEQFVQKKLRPVSGTMKLDED
jgi:hypothetical protein